MVFNVGLTVIQVSNHAMFFFSRRLYLIVFLLVF